MVFTYTLDGGKVYPYNLEGAGSKEHPYYLEGAGDKVFSRGGRR